MGTSLNRFQRLLWIGGLGAVALIFVAFDFFMPKPSLYGTIVDIEVVQCMPVSDRTEVVINYWKDKIAHTPGTTPRRGWEKQMIRDMQEDAGAVLDVVVKRKNIVEMHHMPWNDGRVYETKWKDVDERRSFYFFAGEAPCGKMPIGSQGQFFVEFSANEISIPEDWPPREVSRFINLSLLRAVPDFVRTQIQNAGSQ